MGTLSYVWTIYIKSQRPTAWIMLLWTPCLARVVAFPILNEWVLYLMLSIITEFKLVVKMAENWYRMRGWPEKWQKRSRSFCPNKKSWIAEYSHDVFRDAGIANVVPTPNWSVVKYWIFKITLYSCKLTSQYWMSFWIILPFDSAISPTRSMQCMKCEWKGCP